MAGVKIPSSSRGANVRPIRAMRGLQRGCIQMVDQKTPAHAGAEKRRRLSIFMVIRPAIFTDIQPPWERGELTIIRL